jgi:hypothetical protein
MNRKIEIANIPEELKPLPQWVNWKYEEGKNGKLTKVPYQANGQKAQSTNPATWAIFGRVLSGIVKYSGIGFNCYNGIACIDIDDHLVNGKPDEFAQSIIDRMNSYSEISPSGNGIRIVFKGQLPPGRRKDTKWGFEMYDSGRFFTVTGWHIPGTPKTVEERSKEAAEIHREIFGEEKPAQPPQPAQPNNLEDEELLEKAFNASKGGRLKALYSGDFTGYPSQSEADLALCSDLAFWTGKEAARVDRLFRNSGLYREKWDRKTGAQTYGQLTIQKAVSSTTECYKPSGNGHHSEDNFLFPDFIPDHQDAAPVPEDNEPLLPPETIAILEEYAEEVEQQPEPSPSPLMPALPDLGIDFSKSEGAGRWVDVYSNYAGAVSPMTPPPFHQSGALFLAATAIARRLVVKMPFGDVYPNLFILWVAVTTFFRKSTALNVTRRLARDLFPWLMAAQDTTPEAFLSDLAGKEPAHFDKLSTEEQDRWKRERDFAGQRGLVLDEMSGLMAGAGREYNAGLVEAMLRFYDCDAFYTRSTRGQGRITVVDASLCILGASTPAAMLPHVGAERLWAMGWWPRFAILTPEIDRPEWQEPRETEEPPELNAKLKRLYERLPFATYPDRPRPLTVSLAPGVFNIWSRYNKALSYDLLTPDLDGRLFGTYGRLPTLALKTATILAALDWDTGSAPNIEERHLIRAVDIAETWRGSAHRAIAAAQDGELDRFYQRILAQVAKFEPNGASIREIHQFMRDKRPSEIEMTVLEMVTVGYLEELEPKQGRGRPTKRFRAARE